MHSWRGFNVIERGAVDAANRAPAVNVSFYSNFVIALAINMSPTPTIIDQHFCDN